MYRASSPELGTPNNPNALVAPAPQFPDRSAESAAAGPLPVNTTATQTYVDPYAQWGGQQNYNNLISGFNTQKDTVRSSALDSASNWGLGYGLSIRDLISSLTNSQRGIDKAGVQNELAKKSGTQGVQNMVGRGLKQAGTMLAQKNATNSSASEAVSRAYGDLGRQQLSKVGGQYAAGLADIQEKQNELVEQQGLGVSKLQVGKEQFINSTVADAQNKLAALDAQIAGANLPNRIAIEQEKNNIRAEALARLQAYDAQLSSGVAGIKPTSVDERRSAALQQMNAGVAPETAFDYTTEAPAQFQGTGPYSGSIPLFTMPRNRRE